uniref:Cadherin domain-containing protein n=1 Tax=Echinostoma caproni TaxID=27848 RepID=A0A183A6Y3_9TREM
LRPALQAVADDHNGKKGEICGIVPHGFIEDDLPFKIEVLDRKTGIAEIKLKKNSNIRFEEESTIGFEVEAYDCQEPPNFSKRVPVRVYILNRHGPVFDSLSYQFTVSQHSPTGTVVGQVAAIAEFNSREDDKATKICDYRVSPVDVPFTIDRYGVIRVGTGLEALNANKPYVFQVIAEDCHRPIPLSASVDVQVTLLKQGCQQGWKGLAPDIEYRGTSDSTHRLFWPAKPVLETCTRDCPDPTIRLQLELKSAVDGNLIPTATPQACLHDPEHLNRQRSLCKTNPSTLVNLLPNPDLDLATQLVRPSLGSTPRVMAPSQTMRFSASSLSVWELDPKHLSTESGINAFDTNFTLSFWMRRNMGQTLGPTATPEDREETVICSQDQNIARWRFLSVSFRGCQLIVRMMASFRPGASLIESEARGASQWIFEPLPERYCSPNMHSQSQWHHYAITFSRAPWAATTQLISLMIDGQDPGLNGPDEILTTPIPAYVPSARRADPRITVGACFDPETHLTRQHLNAELTGMTLLFDEVESPSILRCMAQCGESLFVPNVLKYLLADINVTLGSDVITITGQNISHVTDMLTAIMYIRPQPGISNGYTTTVAQSRKLELKTWYQCPNEMAISLPVTVISLNVLPEEREGDHRVESSHPLDANDAGSVWLPEDESQFNRPSAAAAEMERKAKEQQLSRSTVPTLRISGPNVIVADPSTIGPGIPLFADVKFKLWDRGLTKGSAETVAASVPLDSCNIWLVSSGDPNQPVLGPRFHTDQGERIEWPEAMIRKNGFYGRKNERGVELQGRKPAGEYARLLREFRYWPPSTLSSKLSTISQSKRAEKSENEVNYMANVELVCTLDAGNQHTSEFIVKILIPNMDSRPQDRLDKKQVDGYVALSDGVESVNYGQSDRERRQLSGDEKLIRVNHEDAAPSDALSKQNQSIRPGKGHIAGIVISSLIIVIVLVAVALLFVYKRDRVHRKLTRVGRRPRVPEFPADFGGSSLKRDPTLRLTANPVGEMDYYGIGTLSENIHGSTRVLAPKQYIFSPPTTRRENRNSCSSGSAHLAGLEEFDEEYTGPISEGPAESDGNDDLGQDTNSQFQNYSEDQEGDGASDFSPPNEYGADICDWIDDDLENQELMENDQNQPEEPKWNLVAKGPESDFGPPAVDL